MLADRKVTIPGARTRLVRENGLIDPTWLRFFIDLYERTGGGSTDKVAATETQAEAAAAAAVTAQTAADAAQTAADSIDDRLRFDFDFDLR